MGSLLRQPGTIAGEHKRYVYGNPMASFLRREELAADIDLRGRKAYLVGRSW